MTTIARHTIASDLAHDLAVARMNILFDELKAMEQEGKKDATEWLTKWDEYKRRFKASRGYTPHWVR